MWNWTTNKNERLSRRFDFRTRNPRINSDSSRALQEVDVLAVLDLWSPRSRPQSRGRRPNFCPWHNVTNIVICEQTSGIQSSCLMTETRNFKIEDGENVDVLRRPAKGLIRMGNFQKSLTMVNSKSAHHWFSQPFSLSFNVSHLIEHILNLR